MSISCIATNVQRGHDRVPTPNDQPELNPWRCELTALSQVYNLYFVARENFIYIYQPGFPDQSLPKEPALILSPPVSGPNLGHYIDALNPHSINRLHVHFLGREEIVLVSCDDGDVIGYHVSAIQRLIESQSPTDGEKEVFIRPFFHRNIGDTAWGLAVHREARLIAMSANTRKVTVVAFALTRRLSDNSEPSSTTVFGTKGPHSAPSGERPHRVITLAGDTNIPTVAFDNTGCDPSGRWLISCLINGKTLLWDLREPQRPARVIQIGCCIDALNPQMAPPPYCRCGQVPHAVWGVMFIDPRSYHQRPSPTEAFGVFPEEMSPCFWDTSGAKKFLKVNTARDNFPYVVTTPAQHHHDSDSTNESTIDMSEDSEGEEDSIGESSSSHHQQVPDEMSLADEQEDEGTGSDDLSDGGSQNHASNQPVDESDENHSETEGAGLFIPEVATVGNASGFLIGGNALEQALIQLSPGESDSDSMSDISEDTLLQLANRGPIGKRPYCEVTTLGSVHDTPEAFPSTVIVTKDEVYLVQNALDPLNKASNELDDRIVMTRTPLYPPNSLKRPSRDDRLNYFLQIPELGIFAVASPGGRCAIFTLTQFRAKRAGKTQTICGFKEDHLLPFPEQERNLRFPEMKGRLIGIAAGPVQGCLSGKDDDMEGLEAERDLDAKRWRLMMMYDDHTVLSYELGKVRKDQTPGLEDLIV